MKYIILTQVITFVGYTLMIYSLYGVLGSISDSYYKLEKSKKNTGSYFTGFAWILSGTMIAIFAIGNSPVFMLSGVLFGYLGAAPRFKMKTEGLVHTIAATGAIIAALVALWLSFGTWYWLIIYIAIYAILKYTWPLSKENKIIFGEIENLTWWIEIAAFIIVILGLIVS